MMKINVNPFVFSGACSISMLIGAFIAERILEHKEDIHANCKAAYIYNALLNQYQEKKIKFYSDDQEEIPYGVGMINLMSEIRKVEKEREAE